MIGIGFLVVAFIIASVIVNSAFQLFMKIIGADAIFMRSGTKLIVTILVWAVIIGLVGSI